MPHKNPRCRGSHGSYPLVYHYPTKMKHHKWLREYTEWGKDKFHRGEYWIREVICPNCKNIRTDIKMRKASTMRRIRKKQTQRTIE